MTYPRDLLLGSPAPQAVVARSVAPMASAVDARRTVLFDISTFSPRKVREKYRFAASS